jgi:hypothetical protein
MAQQNEPIATPSARAIPAFLLTLIDVPMTARIFGPGLTIATKKPNTRGKCQGGRQKSGPFQHLPGGLIDFPLRLQGTDTLPRGRIVVERKENYL